MIAAVLYTMVLIALIGWPSSAVLLHRLTRTPLPPRVIAAIAGCFTTGVVMSLALCIAGMRSGVAALNEMGK
jgi:hypothetical protein